MGLDINNYGYSYGTLHIIRQWALDTEGKGEKLRCEDFGKIDNCRKCVYCKFSQGKKPSGYVELINHSDCEGGYRKTQKRRNVMWGKLKELKKEVRKLDKNTPPENIKQAWEHFKNDVLGEQELLEFC